MILSVISPEGLLSVSHLSGFWQMIRIFSMGLSRDQTSIWKSSKNLYDIAPLKRKKINKIWSCLFFFPLFFFSFLFPFFFSSLFLSHLECQNEVPKTIQNLVPHCPRTESPHTPVMPPSENNRVLASCAACCLTSGSNSWYLYTARKACGIPEEAVVGFWASCLSWVPNWTKCWTKNLSLFPSQRWRIPWPSL